MILDRLILHDVFAFGHVDLDLASIGPGLVAITGSNGRGKTALLEVVPAINYLQLPARDNDHPVSYATSREGRLEYWATLDSGRIRAVLNLDQQTRGTDGVLEQLVDDGSADGVLHQPLTDGKVSTLKKAIAERFPSYDLFINSVFAGQGRGDEFTRRGPSARKDLFAEFLALGRLLAQAKTAGEAAALVETDRDRLRAVRDAVAADTAPALAATLEQRAIDHEARRAQAEQDQARLQQTISTLEARLATMADAVAAYGASSQRIATLRATLQGRQAERGQVHTERIRASETLAADQTRTMAKATDERADLQKRLDGNRQILDRAGAIREAVDEIARVDAELVHCRSTLTAQQREQDADTAALRAREQALSQLRQVAVRHERATLDASLLADVPCGGEGDYAGCQLLIGAQQAQASLADLVRQLEPKAVLADEIATIVASQDRRRVAMSLLQDTIVAGERARATLQTLAAYAEPLAKAETAIAGYRERLAQLERETTEALQEVSRRHAARDRELTDRFAQLDAACVQLETELATAEADLQATSTEHREATAVRVDLEGARLRWNDAIAAAANAEAGLDQVAREHAALEQKRTRLANLTLRIAVLDSALIEWRSLEKDLGKGGLVDLELDAAGPTITATCNTLLQACFDGRFSIELVTQTEKASGGMKDEFTVRVMDNGRGAWRELRALSGGQKTVVQEALMSAIALYVNERSPHPIRTLWRDETGAALDPENAIAYVRMLRKVCEIGGFHQVLYVSHNEAATALADAQIQVGDGTAQVVLPPYTQEAA